MDVLLNSFGKFGKSSVLQCISAYIQGVLKD